MNRKHFPKELMTSATLHNHGLYKYLSNGPLIACVWVDKHSMYFLSTIHVAEPPSGLPCTEKRCQLDQGCRNRLGRPGSCRTNILNKIVTHSVLEHQVQYTINKHSTANDAKF